MDEQIKPKKSFLKRLWWIGLILVVLIFVSIFIFKKINKQEGRDNIINSDIGSAELKKKAEDALKSGVTITDATNDWLSTGISGDNPSFYPFAAVDLKSLTFAIDNDNLYLKIQTAGKTPKTAEEPQIFDGDKISGAAINIGLDTDNNRKTGVLSDGGSEVFIQSQYQVIESNAYVDLQSFWYGPTGIENPETERYRVKDSQPIGKWGGLGEDYKILAIPLKDLEIFRGQEITVNASGEAASGKYHHASFDQIGTGNPGVAGSSSIKIKLND